MNPFTEVGTMPPLTDDTSMSIPPNFKLNWLDELKMKDRWREEEREKEVNN